MLKTGSIILSIWSCLNFFPSLYVVASILFLGKHPPGLYAILDANDIISMNSQMLATVDSIGLFANLSVAALNLLILVVIWKGLIKGIQWTYWALLASCVLSILAGVAADQAVGFAFPEVNLISAAIVVAGFVICAIGLFKK